MKYKMHYRQPIDPVLFGFKQRGRRDKDKTQRTTLWSRVVGFFVPERKEK